MITLRVVPRITYGNQLLIPRGLYPTLRVPRDVPAYEPITVAIGQMSQKAPDKMPAPAGLTQSEFDVESPAVVPVTPSRLGPVQYRFAGGDLILKVKISVFIIDRYRQVPRLFELIMEHEFLHVRDALALANTVMPTKIRDDRALRPYWEGATWAGSAFFDPILGLWDVEEGRLRAKLDSGTEYENYKRKVAALLPH